MDLRTAITKLTTYHCAWTCEEISELTESPARGTKAYLTALVNQKVLVLSGNQYSFGENANKWKNTPIKKRGPSSYGNSVKYRKQRELWDKLKQRDWEEARKGKILTYQETTVSDSERQETDIVENLLNPDASLSIAQVAAYLDVSDRTIEREIKRGKIKAFRVGLRCVRVTKSELDRYRTDALRNA